MLAVYGTTTVKRWCLRSVRRGVTTSSGSCQLDVAERPSTVTGPTVSPAKSRLKRERFCVARASITATPCTVCSGSAVG